MKNGIGSISQIALKVFKMKNRIRSPTNGTLNEELISNVLKAIK